MEEISALVLDERDTIVDEKTGKRELPLEIQKRMWSSYFVFYGGSLVKNRIGHVQNSLGIHNIR